MTQEEKYAALLDAAEEVVLDPDSTHGYTALVRAVGALGRGRAAIVAGIPTGIKVWSGLSSGISQRRIVVAAKTKKRARELLELIGNRISVGELNNYWSETGNYIQLRLVDGEGVWRMEDDKYVRLWPKGTT